MDDFDNVQKIIDLQFTFPECHADLKRLLKTSDQDKHLQVLRQGVIREILAIQNRKNARKYQENRERAKNENESDF